MIAHWKKAKGSSRPCDRATMVSQGLEEPVDEVACKRFKACRTFLVSQSYLDLDPHGCKNEKYTVLCDIDFYF